VALGVPGRLRPQIISTFGITRVVGCQPYAPAVFTPGEISEVDLRAHDFVGRNHGKKKSPMTPQGIDPGTVRLNHYAIPGLRGISVLYIYIYIYIYNKTSIKRNILTIKQNTLGSRSG
jgi:hypothetical protein